MAQIVKQDISDIRKLVREVYSYIPSPEAYVGKYTDLATTEGVEKNFIRHALKEFNITKENFRSDETPKVTKAEMEALWTKMYGEGSFGTLRQSNTAFPYDFMEQPWMFMYVPPKDTYVFEYSGVVMPSQTPYRRLLRWEASGSRLYLFDLFGIIGDNGEDGAKRIYFLNGAMGSETEPNKYTVLKFARNRGMDKPEITKALNRGDYDGILPTYRHTFRRTADGCFWVGSELI